MKVNLPPRRLIPRWRRTKAVLNMPEATFSSSDAEKNLTLDPARLDHAIMDWKLAPTTGLLGDILSFSIDSSLRTKVTDLVRNDSAIRRVATATQEGFIDQLLDESGPPHVTAHLEELSGSVGICNQAVRHEAATLKKILVANPANPLALLDLAQFQLASGQIQRAERSIRSALSLSPNNRIALRTLSRLYVHQLEFDKAHSLISRHVRTTADPWLMATEIALAEVANVPSHFISKGSRFVRDKMASKHHLSELAGSIGGAELRAGNVKRAREMFRLALASPNDNVIAQAVTHQSALGIDLTAPAQHQAIVSAHEAQTILAWEAIDCTKAKLHALAWHDEEPFSSRPLQFLTTLYAAQRDYEPAKMLAKRGLIADPKDPALLANLAYVSASSGDRSGAEKMLRKLLALKLDKYNAVTLATAGLMLMQEEKWDAGNKLYETAMEIFRHKREFAVEAICCAYFARSATDSGHPERDAILLRAQAMYQKHPSPDAAVVLRLLDANVLPLVEPEQSRRLSQWVLDMKTESLIQVHGVSKPGAPPLVIKR